jgi:hypothetical protein
MAAPSMDIIAKKYENRGVDSIFLYTHEAHPGEYYPHLTSMEQKFNHAIALIDVLGVSRPIYVDSLDGACHRAYGSMPNMSWIFTGAGIPIYKSDWTDANSIENAIQYFLNVNDRRQAGEKIAPFHVERLDYRNHDREMFYQGLARNGPSAVKQFKAAFGK